MKARRRFTGAVSAYASLIAIAVGLLFGLAILLISNPAQAFTGLRVILLGGFNGGAKGVGQVLYYATPIIMTGLSVGFAFKTGLFNIGAAGQLMVGSFAAVYVGVRWTFLPGGLHWFVGLLAAIVMGGLWGLVPGLFKAFLNVNEVISSIMMNYIGMYGVNAMVRATVYDQLKNQSLNVAATAVIPKWGLDKVFYSMRGAAVDASLVNAGIFIALFAAVFIYVLLNRTTFGYELKACGYNREASRYAGINEKRSIALSMAIAGMLAGAAGALMYLAPANGLHIRVEEILSAQGFNGIPVALLGLSNPIGIIFAALFVAHIEQGGFYLQKLNYMREIIDIIIAAIIYFSAFSLLFRRVIQKFGLRLRGRGAKGGVTYE